MIFTVRKMIQRTVSILLVHCSTAMAVEVSTCEQLDEAINFLHADNIELTNDIECAHHKFIPRGIAFSGHFNGRGYAIHNLQIVGGASYNAGLFETINSATIENLTLHSPAIDFSHGGFQSIALLGSFVTNSIIQTVSLKNFVVSTQNLESVSALIGTARDSEFDNIAIDNVIINAQYLFNTGTIAGSVSRSTINNVTITGMSIYATGNPYSNSVIGGIAGLARDVSITNSSVSIGNILGGESCEVGGLVGRMEGNSLIENVRVQGKVYGVDHIGGIVGSAAYANHLQINHSGFDGEIRGHQWVGGLAGTIGNSTIEESHASGLVEGRLSVGGLLGDAWRDVNISKSYSNNNVMSGGSGGGSAGGLIGDAGSDILINESYSRSTVQSENNQNIGGLVGLANADGLVISNSFFAGSATGYRSVGGLLGGNLASNSSVSIIHSYVVGAIRGNNAGGLVGTSNGAIDARNSYWDIHMTGQEQSARDSGEGKTTAQMQEQNNYTNWDFNNIWLPIDPHNPQYPQLRYFN